MTKETTHLSSPKSMAGEAGRARRPGEAVTEGRGGHEDLLSLGTSAGKDMSRDDGLGV